MGHGTGAREVAKLLQYTNLRDLLLNGIGLQSGNTWFQTFISCLKVTTYIY